MRSRTELRRTNKKSIHIQFICADHCIFIVGSMCVARQPCILNCVKTYVGLCVCGECVRYLWLCVGRIDSFC